MVAQNHQAAIRATREDAIALVLDRLDDGRRVSRSGHDQTICWAPAYGQIKAARTGDPPRMERRLRRRHRA